MKPNHHTGALISPDCLLTRCLSHRDLDSWVKGSRCSEVADGCYLDLLGTNALCRVRAALGWRGTPDAAAKVCSVSVSYSVL